MKRLSCILLFFAVATGFSQETGTTPQIGFKVALGETVVIEGVSIEFVEVLEDSRCPVDVVCVWEGQVRVKVIVSGTPALHEVIEVTLGINKPNMISSYEGYVIKAIGLAPYPTTKDQGKRDYRLLLRREKL